MTGKKVLEFIFCVGLF